MSINYGLTHKDFEDAKTKIAKQKNYMENHTFVNDQGEIKSLLDFSFSANLSNRYYPRILNKVNTFVSLAINKDLTPVFLTVTLDGFFRDLMRGDYTRFYKKIDDYREHIPNNDRSGKYLDYLINGSYSDIKSKKTYGVKLLPRDLYKILGHQLHRFNRSRTLQDIRQIHNEDYMMIRVTEPHKDGVPHFHILMYLPERFIPALYIKFNKFFPAPQNSKLINLKEDGREPDLIFPDQYETKGFQTKLRSPAGYILKYILKSFRNLIEGKELDYLQAWYIHNRIPRIITTHSLISQEVHYHASLLDDDWYYLTNLKLNHYYERDTVFNTFHIKDDRREFIFDNGYYKLISNGFTVKEFGENKTFKIKFTVDCPVKFPYIPKLPISFTTKFWRLVPKPKYSYEILKPIEVSMPDGTKVLYDVVSGIWGQRKEFFPVNKLTDLELYQWYQNFDFDIHSAKKFGLVRNTLIDRGLLDDLPISLNEFNTDFNEKIGLHIINCAADTVPISYEKNLFDFGV